MVARLKLKEMVNSIKTSMAPLVVGGEEPDWMKCMHDGIVYKYFCNGEWRTSTSGRTIKNLTPYDEKVCYEVQAVTTQEVDEAYETAKKLGKIESLPLLKLSELLI